MRQYFHESHEPSGRSVKFEFDHATKVNIKKAIDIDTSTLASKTGLAKLKT